MTGIKRWFLCSLVLTSLVLIFFVPTLVMRNRKPIAFVWPRNVTRDVTSLLSGSYGLSPSLPSDTILLVVVCSGLTNHLEREAIRESWASGSLRPLKTEVVFLMGHTTNDTQQQAIVKEADQYKDILQADFVDNYANLTVKSLYMLNWFASKEPAKFLMKTDDDMYVNLNFLLDSVLNPMKDDVLVGSLICGAVPIRDPYNKWYCPYYMFGGTVYPNYLSGTGYVMSHPVAVKLMEEARRVPAFHLEDIYLTGLLAAKANVRPKDHVGFSYTKRLPSPCLYAQSVTSHHLSTSEVKEMAKKVKAVRGCRPLLKQHRRPYGPGKCKWK